MLCRKAAFCTQAVINLGRSEWLARAHTGPVGFVLRTLAAQELPQEREISCRRAEGRPAIHVDRSKDRWSNLHTADKAFKRLSVYLAQRHPTLRQVLTPYLDQAIPMRGP